MNPGRTLSRFAAAAALCLGTTVAESHSCSFLFASACDAAESAGREAAQKVADGMRESTQNLLFAVNPLMSIVRDLDGPEGPAKETAKKMARRLLGDNYSEDIKKDYQLRVTASGLTPGKSMRVILLLDDNNLTTPPDTSKPDKTPLAETILKAQRSDFNSPTELTSGAPADPAAYKKSLDAIRADIKSAIAKILPRTLQLYGADCNGGCSDVYSQQVDQNYTDWATIIMKVSDDRIDLRTKQEAATSQWRGQRYITVVIPDEDLQKNLKAKLFLSISLLGQPDKLIPYYAAMVPKASEISLHKWRDQRPTNPRNQIMAEPTEPVCKSLIIDRPGSIPSSRLTKLGGIQ
jgi:hypothetical protein